MGKKKSMKTRTVQQLIIVDYDPDEPPPGSDPTNPADQWWYEENGELTEDAEEYLVACEEERIQELRDAGFDPNGDPIKS